MQPVEQSWDFHGYVAPFVHFQDGRCAQERTRELGAPVVYQTLAYEQELPGVFSWAGEITIETDGRLNALRFITKNVLAIVTEERRTIDWLNHYMVVPGDEAAVSAGERLRVSFSYAPGAPLSALAPAVERLTAARDSTA